MTVELAVAKAALSAALLRADPESVGRSATEDFIQLLNDTVDECSPFNVQKCKNWIVENVASSAGRTATLGKYLANWMESMERDFDRPSVKRRRLYALYVVNDVLHHVVVRQGKTDFRSAFALHLPAMVTAASFETCPRHLRKVKDLISLWEEKGYIHQSTAISLQNAFSRASDRFCNGSLIHTSPATVKKLADEMSYELPEQHGDPSLPWHEQPAGTWLPHLTSSSRKPLHSHIIRPISQAPGPADSGLVDAVKKLMGRMDEIFGLKPLENGTRQDVNALGDVVKQHEDEQLTYYGWSKSFLREMRRWKKAKRGSRYRRSRSSTRSSSVSHHQDNDFRQRGRSSSSRSTSPGNQGRGFVGYREPSPSRTPSHSRYRRRRSRSSSRGRARSRSYSPAHDDFQRQRSRSRSPVHTGFHAASSRAGDGASFPSLPPSPHHPDPTHPPAGPYTTFRESTMADTPSRAGFPIPPPPPPIGWKGTFPPPPLQGWSPGQAGFPPPPPPSMGGGNPWNAPVAGPPRFAPPPPPPGASMGGNAPPQNGWGRASDRGYRGRGRGGGGHGGYGYGYGSR